VAIREIELSDKIALSILELLQHIGRWETYLQLWPATPRLCAALTELFAQIINFLVRAIIYYRDPPHSKCDICFYSRYLDNQANIYVATPERYRRAAFTFFNEKIEKILANIVRLADNSEKEALLALQIGMCQSLINLIILF